MEIVYRLLAKAVDGAVEAAGGDGGPACAQTSEAVGTTRKPWWRVDLGGEVAVGVVRVTNRAGSAKASRLAGFEVRVAAPGGAAMTEAAADPRSASIRIGVRRAFTGQVRQKVQPLGTSGGPGCLGSQQLVRVHLLPAGCRLGGFTQLVAVPLQAASS